MRTTFLLSKDPSYESTGDVTMAKLVMKLARDSHSVDAICLSPRPASTKDGYRRVFKSAPSPLPLLRNALRNRRSLVHCRFLLDDLVAAVSDTDTDLFVADHSFMAEAAIAALGADSATKLAVSTVVPEPLIWRATRGVIGRLEAPRIARDEARVARAARTVGSYDLEESEYFANLGVKRSYWLDVTLPSNVRVPVESTGKRLVFLGDRRWAPNHEALLQLLEWWPQISAGIPDAELCIVGAPDPDVTLPDLPAGVQDVGFVDDLDEMMSTCRALAAPIRTGGGVRVKILDAVSRGLPVVGTTAAVGSLGDLLGIAKLDAPDTFIEQCRRYLLDRDAAAAEGRRLYEINTDRWNDRLPHKTVGEWLS